MQQIDAQRINELAYCKQHFDTYVRSAFDKDSGIQAKILEGARLLDEWRRGSYYASKQARIDQVQDLDLVELTTTVFVQIAHYQRSTTFVSVVAQVANELGFSDHVDGITTMAEIIGVLCNTDVFDITKASAQASLMIHSRIKLPQQLQVALDRGLYPIPMLVQPDPIRANHESPYLTFNESQILGKRNHHQGNISLDVINIQNSIPLACSVDFLTTVEEMPNKAFDDLEQQLLWNTFRNQSYGVYHLLVTQGNRFYLTNKVDKRGRLYSQGYHVTTQGTSFKKAMLELADGEVVTGVPQ
jgi:hypothetical protein